MPWREFEINNFGGMVTNVPMKDKSESLLVENLTLAEKPGVLTLRKGYSELYEAPPIFPGEQNSIVAYTTFVTDKPSREEIFVVARRWSRNGKKGLNFWVRKAFNKWTNEFEDKWQLVNPVFFGTLRATPCADKCDSFLLELDDDISATGLNMDDLIGFAIELPEYGIKTEILSIEQISGNYKIKTAKCFKLLEYEEEEELDGPNLLSETPVILYASFLPQLVSDSLYDSSESDVVFHNVLNGLRMGFGGRENAIGLSLGYIEYCLDVDKVSGDCERTLTSDELKKYKKSRKGFFINEYTIITNNFYGIETEIVSSDESLDLGYYKIRMTALLDDFNEVLVAEKTVSIEESGKGVQVTPYIELGGENKRITAFRLYASIDGVTFQKFGEDIFWGASPARECVSAWSIDANGRAIVSREFTSSSGVVDLQYNDNAVAPGDKETSSLDGVHTVEGASISVDSPSADESGYGNHVASVIKPSGLESTATLAVSASLIKAGDYSASGAVIQFEFALAALREDSGDATNDISVDAFVYDESGSKRMLNRMDGVPESLPILDYVSYSHYGFDNIDLSSFEGRAEKLVIILGNVPKGVRVFVDELSGVYYRVGFVGSGDALIERCYGCLNESADHLILFDPADSTEDSVYVKNVETSNTSDGSYAVSFKADTIPSPFYMYFDLDSSETAFGYRVFILANILKQNTNSTAKIFIAKNSSPTVDIGVFSKEVSLVANQRSYIEVSEVVNIQSNDSLALTIMISSSDTDDEIRAGVVAVERKKYISGFDKSTVFGEDMEDVLGYIPTFDYVRDWAFAVSLNGRIHYLAPYIDKKYHNLIVQSHISGAGAFMYDIATPENFLNIEKYAGGEPVGMAIMPTSDLLILRTNGFTIVDPDNNYIRENNVTAGCVAKKSIIQSGNSVFWCGDDDIYALSPSSGLVPRGITGKTIRDIYLRSFNKEFVIAEVDEYGVVVFLLEDERGRFEARIEPNGWVVSRYNTVQKFIKFLTLRGVMSFVNSEGGIYLKEENVSNCIE